MDYKKLAEDALDAGNSARAQAYALLALVEQGEPKRVTFSSSDLTLEDLRDERGNSTIEQVTDHICDSVCHNYIAKYERGML